ncbi:MAG TPA: site-2 protease family protein, partial [Actinomycetota bacterium]|nr:site-2 protease family protein [Actinomycetota bacterium]
MTSTFTFIRVRGIPIGAHWTWLFVFGLVVWSLTSSLFPGAYPGLADGTYLAMGVAAGVLFFVSVLLHELGHALQAVRDDMEIEGITLWLLGGVARFRGMFPSPGAEFRIAIAGPVVSVAITAFFGLLAFLGGVADLPEPVIGVTEYLWRINGILVAFNLVPALPLDGGRVLRSWLWHRQRSFSAATVSASKAGKAFGFLLVAIGILNTFSGSDSGGLWFVFLGWFLIQAAGAEASMMQVRSTLGDRRVGDVMTTEVRSVAAGETVESFLVDVGPGPRHALYPVTRAGVMIGALSMEQAGAVPVQERAFVRVESVMTPRPDVRVLTPSDPVTSALELFQDEPRRAPVLEAERVVGFLSLSDIAHLLEVQGPAPQVGHGEPAKAGALVWVVVGFLMLLAAGYLYRPAAIVVEPGPVLDVTEDISISGVATGEVNGEYLLTSVRIRQPNALGLVWAMLRGREVMSEADVVPEGIDEQRYFEQERRIFRESQEFAAAAAAGAAGLDVSITGSGASVEQVVEGAPAAAGIRAGDTIVEVDGRTIELATD